MFDAFSCVRLITLIEPISPAPSAALPAPSRPYLRRPSPSPPYPPPPPPPKKNIRDRTYALLSAMTQGGLVVWVPLPPPRRRLSALVPAPVSAPVSCARLVLLVRCLVPPLRLRPPTPRPPPPLHPFRVWGPDRVSPVRSAPGSSAQRPPPRLPHAIPPAARPQPPPRGSHRPCRPRSLPCARTPTHRGTNPPPPPRPPPPGHTLDVDKCPPRPPPCRPRSPPHARTRADPRCRQVGRARQQGVLRRHQEAGENAGAVQH